MKAEAGLRIPKIAVVVEIAVDDRGPDEVEVFVAEHTDHAYRRERLLDLLEDDHSQFLPGRDIGSDEWRAYNKETIAWVGVPLAEGSLPVEESQESALDEQLFDVAREVSVKLISARFMSGQLLYTPPQGQTRVSDHLNGGGRFFRLWTTDHVFLINKRYVLYVVERDDNSKGASS